MKLNRTGSNWNRLERNKINENWDIIEGSYNDVVGQITDEVVGHLIDSAKLIWKEPVDTVEDLPANAEVGETRMAREADSDGLSYVYRYDGEKWEKIQAIDVTLVNEVDRRLTRQLVELADRSFYGKLMQHKKPKKLITILDDDARVDLFNIMYPAIKRLGIKMTAAIITERVNNPNSPGTINFNQYYEMLNSGYVEMISHSATHRHLANMPIEEAEHELKSSKEWILRHGGNPDYFVYPFNSKNPAVIEKTREYYKGAFSTTGIINQTPLDSLLIDRVDFDRDASYLKNKIDELDANGGWLVFNSHAWYDSVTEEFVEEIVNYGLNKGIEFVTVGEAMKHFGNIIDTEFGVLGANGEGTGVFSNEYRFISGTTSDVTASTPITSFEVGTTLLHFVKSQADSRGFPEAGLYEVQRTTLDFSRAYYYPYRSKNYYVRYWDRDNEKWTTWEYVDFSDDNELTVNEVSANTSPNEMSREYFTTKITSTNSEGFPEGVGGLLTTDLRGGTGYQFQTFRGQYRDRIAFRNWTSQGWTSWKQTDTTSL